MHAILRYPLTHLSVAWYWIQNPHIALYRWHEKKPQVWLWRTFWNFLWNIFYLWVVELKDSWIYKWQGSLSLISSPAENVNFNLKANLGYSLLIWSPWEARRKLDTFQISLIKLGKYESSELSYPCLSLTSGLGRMSKARVQRMVKVVVEAFPQCITFCPT